MMKKLKCPCVSDDDGVRSAMAEILKIHNSPNTIKPPDIEEMEECGLLNDLKA